MYAHNTAVPNRMIDILGTSKNPLPRISTKSSRQSSALLHCIELLEIPFIPISA